LLEKDGFGATDEIEIQSSFLPFSASKASDLCCAAEDIPFMESFATFRAHIHSSPLRIEK